MARRPNYSGLLIAGIGFFLTRFTVTLALYDDPVRFFVAGVLPLLLGLGLAAFGVALTVADVDPIVVRYAARWCVIGLATMAVLVALTLVGSSPDGVPSITEMRSQLYLSNFLIAGSLGGTLTGLYAARTRRQRVALEQQTNRLEALNRMLRHEVLNAITVIQGYAALDADDERTPEIIQEHADAITETIDRVRYLTQHTTTGARTSTTTDLVDRLQTSIDTINTRYPDATIDVDSLPDELPVSASTRLELVFEHLLENAIVHADTVTPAVHVGVSQRGNGVAVAIRDEGPGIPDAQRTLLQTGELTEFDDPRDGYGLNVVRLVVESFDGDIDTDVTNDGSTVTVTIPQKHGAPSGIEESSGLSGIRVDTPHLTITLGASLVAGVVYGLLSESLGGSVAAIGVFYGISNPIVGWLTHEFHSAVFGFVFAGLVSYLPARYHNHVPTYVAVGTAWGVALWLLAAGVIAPIWLQLLGIAVPVPNISTTLLITHVAWGITLGLLTALGARHLTPTLERLTERIRTRTRNQGQEIP